MLESLAFGWIPPCGLHLHEGEFTLLGCSSCSYFFSAMNWRGVIIQNPESDSSDLAEYSAQVPGSDYPQHTLP